MHWPSRMSIIGSGPEWVSLRAGWYNQPGAYPAGFGIYEHLAELLGADGPRICTLALGRAAHATVEH